MNKQLKQKWIKALRSGNYSQGRGKLRLSPRDHTPNVSYCCLGVLLCVSGKFRIIGEQCEHYDFVDSEIGSIRRTELADMNDYDKKTFDEIADHIEQNI